MIGFKPGEKIEEGSQQTAGPQLQQATERIAEALRGIVTSAASDIQAQAADGRAKLAEMEDRQRIQESALQAVLQRLEAQAATIQSLRQELGRRGGLLEKLVGTLRTLDLRSEPRVPTEKAVKVEVIGSSASPANGWVVDAAETGLGLMLEKSVPAGSQVRLDVDGTVLQGNVARCRTEGNGYVAGLSSVQKVED